jgi:hypothetical protein
LEDQTDLLKLVIYILNKEKILVFKEMVICKHLTNSIFPSGFRLEDLRAKKIKLLTCLKLRVSFVRHIEIAYQNIVKFELADFLDLKM